MLETLPQFWGFERINTCNITEIGFTSLCCIIVYHWFIGVDVDGQNVDDRWSTKNRPTPKRVMGLFCISSHKVVFSFNGGSCWREII